jgi:hypothetical protein
MRHTDKMNPEFWGNLPPDLVERIAHFADIDSRRALGFLPRKLVLPDLDLPFQRQEYIEFNQGISRLIKLRNAHLYVRCNEIAWQFGTNDFMTSRTYSFQRDDGLVSFYALLKTELSRHPDFNEDGSWRTSRCATWKICVASQPRVDNRSDI